MNDQGLIDVDRPLGLDSKFLSSQPLTQPLKDFKTPAEQASVNKPLDLNNLIPDDVFKNIIANAENSASKKNPNESKFVDKELTSRYAGRLIDYNNIGLDTANVDAKYAKTQSIFETSLNNFQVGMANGGAMFASAVLGIPDIVNNIISGDFATESKLQNALFDFTESVNKNNVNFQTEQDQKTDAWNTIKNIVLPTYFSGATTGWGTLFESAMYGVGAGAGLATTELLASAVPGVGNSAALARFVATTIGNLDKIRKFATIGERVYDTSKAFSNIRTALDVTNKITEGAKWGFRLGIAPHGEAAFEALETKHNLGETLKQDYFNKNGYNPSGKDAEQIDKIVNEASQTRYLANYALLAASGFIGYKRLFKNLDLAKETAQELAKQGLRIGIKDGKGVVEDAVQLSGWWNKGFQKHIAKAALTTGKADLVKEAASEGTEEFLQLGIDESTNEYSKWRLNHGGQDSIDAGIKAIQEGLGQSFNTKGLGAWVSGAISGIAQQAAFSVIGNTKGLATGGATSWELSKRRKEEIQNTISKYDGFNINDVFNTFNVNSVRGTVTSRALDTNALGVADKAMDHATLTDDKKLYKDAESVNRFTLIKPYAERGHTDLLKQQFAFALENKEENEVSDLFGAPITKTEAITKFNEYVDKANASYSNVRGAFKNIFKPNDPRYQIFNDYFIPELAFLDYRINDLNERKDSIQSDLGDYYDEFKYFAQETDLSKGKSYIESQIKEVKETESYLKSLPDNTVEDVEAYNKEKHLAFQYERALDSLNKYETNKTQKNYVDFLNHYQEAMVTKLDRNDRGFINRDEVMNKLTDFHRINNDIIWSEKVLRGYLTKTGFETFAEEFGKYSTAQQRQRDSFERTEEFGAIIDELKDKYTDLSEDEINSIVDNSSSAEDARKAAKMFSEAKSKKIEEDNKASDEIRDKFIKDGRGDIVEEYLKEGNLNLKDADKFLSELNDTELVDKKNKIISDLVDSLKPLGEFKEENLLKYIDQYTPENKAVYDTLSIDGKIEFTDKIIKALRDTKAISNPTISKLYDTTINKYIDLGKVLKISKPKEFTPNVEEYNGEIIEHITPTEAIVNGVKVDSNKAKDIIDSKLEEEFKQEDLSFEEIANLENKFEGSYYNPNWFDENGNPVGADENNSEAYEALNKEFLNKSESQISEMIGDNLSVEFFDGENLKGKDIISILPQEKILTSRTSDAIVLSYKLNDKNIPLTTIKSYTKGLGILQGDQLKKILLTRLNETDANKVVSFVKPNYFDFLKDSVKNPEVYNILASNGFLKFKGTPQEQLDMLIQRDRIFNQLKEGNPETLKDTFDFKRLYYVMETKKTSTQPITGIKHPYALLKGKGEEAFTYYSFFRLKNNFKQGAEIDIEIIDTPDDLSQEIKDKVSEGFNNLHKTKPGLESFGGYYMLITDSKGTPNVKALTAKEIDSKDFLSAFNNTEDINAFKGVTIQDDSNRFTITTKKENGKLSIILTDKSTAKEGFEGNTLFLKNIVLNSTSVNTLFKTLLSNINTNNWNGENNTQVKTKFQGEFKFVKATATKPTTVQEFLDTRDVKSINHQNFKIDKLVITEKNIDNIINTPPIQEETVGVDELFVPTEQDRLNQIDELFGESPVLTDIVSLGASVGVDVTSARKFPQTVTEADVAELVDKISTLIPQNKNDIAKFIIFATASYKATHSGDIYLNDNFIQDGTKLSIFVEKMNGNQFQVANVFKNNALNLFTDRSVPKTRVINNQLQEILEQCL